MRLFASIFTAIFFCIVLFYIGITHLNDYVSSKEFLQDIYINAIWFALTVGIIGVIVTAYQAHLQRQLLRPAREYFAGRFEEVLKRFLRAALDLTAYGTEKLTQYDDSPYVLVGEPHKIPKYFRFPIGMPTASYIDLKYSIAELTELIDQHRSDISTKDIGKILSIREHLTSVAHDISLIEEFVPTSSKTRIAISLQAVKGMLEKLGADLSEENFEGNYVVPYEMNPASGFSIRSDIGADERAKWDDFFENIKEVMGPYNKYCNNILELRKKYLRGLDKFPLLSIRGFIFAESPDKNGLSVSEIIRSRLRGLGNDLNLSDTIIGNVDISEKTEVPDNLIIVKLPPQTLVATDQALFPIRNLLCGDRPDVVDLLRRNVVPGREQEFEEILSGDPG